MFSLLLLAAVSFGISTLLTPLFRDLCHRWGMVDQPDGARKIHAAPIPRIGGVPILLAYAGAFGALFLTPMQGKAIAQSGVDLALRLLPALAVTFLTGLIDDLRHLRPSAKLAGQVAAATLAFAAGVRISGVAGIEFGLVLSFAVTLGWFVVCMNAFNLIDGLDGLASGVGLCGALTVLAAAWMQGNFALAMAAVPLAGALAGFLRFNRAPASVFLGDSGSLLIGFLLGSSGIIWGQKSATLFSMSAPVIAMALPIGEMVLSTVRRMMRGQPISQADRRHIHHRLLDQGLTPRRAAYLLYGVCAVFAALSLSLGFIQQRFAGLVVIAFCGAVWYGIRNLGYHEFQVAGDLIAGGAFQQLLDVQVELRQLSESLDAAESWDARVEVLRRACRAFGFCGFELRLPGETVSALDHYTAAVKIRIEAPLANGGAIVLERELNQQRRQLAVPEFTRVVREHLSAPVATSADSLGALARAASAGAGVAAPVPR